MKTNANEMEKEGEIRDLRLWLADDGSVGDE